MQRLHTYLYIFFALFFIIPDLPLNAQEIIDINVSVPALQETISYSQGDCIVDFYFGAEVKGNEDFFNPIIKKSRGFSAFMGAEPCKNCSLLAADAIARKLSVSVNLPTNEDGQMSAISFRFQDASLDVDIICPILFVYRKPRLFLFSSGQQYLNSNKELTQQADTVFHSCLRNPSIAKRFKCLPDSTVYICLDTNASSLMQKIDAFSCLPSKPSDVAMLYFKGHGVYKGGVFSYSTSDGNQIDGAVVVQMVKAFSERKTPVFLFMDACFAGGLGPQLSNLTREMGPVHFYMGAGPADEKKDDGRFADRLSKALSQTTVSSSTIKSQLFPSDTPRLGGYMCYPSLSETIICESNDVSPVLKKKTSNLLPACLSILPGLGQYYKKEYVKSGVFAGMTLLGGGGILLCESNRRWYLQQATQTHDVTLVKTYTAKSNNILSLRNVCIGVAAVTYIWNIFDAAIAPNKRNLNITPSSVVYSF